MNATNRRVLIVVAAAFLTLTLAIAVLGHNYADANNKIISEESILEGQLLRGELNNSIGEEKVYPEYYVGVNIYRLDISEVEDGLVKDSALSWWASGNDITISDDELSDYIDNLISDAQLSDEFAEYDQAAAELGTSFENIIRTDQETYRGILIKSKLYDLITGNNTEMEFSGEEYSEYEKEKQIIWDEFETSIIEEYKQTDTYSKLLSEFELCNRLSSENVTEPGTIIQMYEENTRKAFN